MVCEMRGGTVGWVRVGWDGEEGSGWGLEERTFGFEEAVQEAGSVDEGRSAEVIVTARV